MKNTILLILFSLFFLIKGYGQDIVKPNIILFYADDLGWQDTQLNDEGAIVPWETPNMLSLAAEGAKFSQAYSPAPTCAPSRTAMMSGHHTTQTKMTHVAGGRIPEVNTNNDANKLIHPYYSGRLQVEETTIAEALSPAGYATGHVGKWHMSYKHNTFPEAVDQGFDYQFTERGMHSGMDNRTIGYATDAADDPYRIDEDGRPYDSVTESALDFLEDNVTDEKPFFLYMATWLVHTPIQTRDLALLTYYANKLGIDVPTTDTDIKTGGQTNPYYGAMVSTLDWSLGKIVDYLKATDDPRNPGKKLFETTYIIFSSDNGGSENKGAEIITDNFPLDEGKKHAQEGGIRTPLVITGPNIPVGEFDNVVSHLDFFPTILSLTGTTVDNSISDKLDGVDLTSLIKGESLIVKDSNGNERTDLFWHFPHNQDHQMQSAIRSGNYKLYKNYVDGSYEVYQLYNSDGTNNDLEEAINIIDIISESTKVELISKLETFLTGNNARIPQWNADYSGTDAPLENQNNVPSIISTSFDQNTNTATTVVSNTASQSAIDTAYYLYQKSDSDDEWFELPATVNGNTVTATDIHKDATMLVFTLIDENNFLIVSEEISTIPVVKVTLNVTEEEQRFEPENAEVYAELIGGATANNAYIQMTTDGGGDGFNINVNAPEPVLCEKVVFRVRSKAGDTANFDITIDGVTQNLEYTSTNDSDDLYFEFNTPITITEAAKTMNFLLTGLTNSNVDTSSRFRVYAVTFHLDLNSLGVDDVENDIENLNTFPNPVKNTFNLTKEVKYGVLYNVYGAIVHKFENISKDIDIRHLKTGLYLLKVIDKDGNKKHTKLLKE
jgi:arylsulfatase A-like enzyme